ncbi:M3 peptidase [Helicosporidium sp. ATCC 50920]|nr:M3 peptidase [Helicosporidium sp. ATCC 50920]|eukprot:KDD74554.1 M3 peptidase [Helicosporidium sp. ATCC 50920]
MENEWAPIQSLKLYSYALPGLDELESETTATWCKVVQPLEMLYDGYERVTNVFEFLTTVNHTVKMEAAVSQGMALARGFPRRLQQSTALYALLRKMRYEQASEFEHSHQQLRVLDHWIARMNEHGINFATDATKMATFRRLDDEEAELKRKFLDNVRQGTAAFYLTLRDGQHLRGVPRSTLEAMAAAAQTRNLTYSTGLTGAMHPPISDPPLDGAAPTPEWGPWTVTFDPFVYESMMAYCPSRRLRQIIYQSFENRASQEPWNNVPVVERLLQVRRSRANLLDSASYADLVGRRRMTSLHRANEFLDAILAPVASAAFRTLLQIVRLMAESEARGEDVWSNHQISKGLDFFSADGQRLAMDQNSHVTIPTEMALVYYTKFSPSNLRPYGMAPIPPPLKINTGSLEQAERYMSNNTVSQLNCVALLAKVTPRLRNWDYVYWAARLESTMKFLNKTNAASPPENLNTYLTLSRVLSGAFGLFNRLWGVHAVEVVHSKPPVWHPDVKYFQLFNGSELLGSFFFDPFARPNKLSGPFTQILIKRSEAHSYLPEKVRLPVVVMSTNIEIPPPGKPTLLHINDVLAIFRELGHVFQNLAHKNDKVLTAGAATLPLDFSEMFGQFYELWASEERPIKMLEQLYMSKLDLSFHSAYKANATETVFTHRHQVATDTLLLPYSTNNCDFCTLVDAFGSGHGAGYYSHLWSEAYASDAMGYFEEVGILNDTQVRALGEKMATALLSGAQDDANAQYEVNSA